MTNEEIEYEEMTEEEIREAEAKEEAILKGIRKDVMECLCEWYCSTASYLEGKAKASADSFLRRMINLDKGYIRRWGPIELIVTEKDAKEAAHELREEVYDRCRSYVNIGKEATRALAKVLGISR